MTASKRMTQEEYLAANGEFCPHCRKPCGYPWEIVPEPDGHGRGYKYCKPCDYYWDEIYDLACYETDDDGVQFP